MSMWKAISTALALCALCVPTAAMAHSRPAAQASRTCDISGKERKLGTTYVTSLTASGLSCAKAESFVKAYHRCRHRHGAAGRCSHLSGYKCSEKRDGIATQYDSRATCTKTHRKIAQIYTQNT